jgi:hypothetical protein
MAYIQTPAPTGASVNIIVGAKSQSETRTGDLDLLVVTACRGRERR